MYFIQHAWIDLRLALVFPNTLTLIELYAAQANVSLLKYPHFTSVYYSISRNIIIYNSYGTYDSTCVLVRLPLIVTLRFYAFVCDHESFRYFTFKLYTKHCLLTVIDNRTAIKIYQVVIKFCDWGLCLHFAKDVNICCFVRNIDQDYTYLTAERTMNGTILNIVR